MEEKFARRFFQKTVRFDQSQEVQTTDPLSGDRVFTGYFSVHEGRGGVCRRSFRGMCVQGVSTRPLAKRDQELVQPRRLLPPEENRRYCCTANRQIRRLVERTRSLAGVAGARGGRTRTGAGGTKATRSPGEIEFRFWGQVSTSCSEP